MQFLANYKGISMELKKRYVFNEILSTIIIKLKQICEKENERREYSTKTYEQSLPLYVEEEMLKMCPNIICLPSKVDVKFVGEVDPNEFKSITNKYFSYFFKLANIDMSKEIEEYKARLWNSCEQINEMKKKIDDLQKQLEGSNDMKKKIDDLQRQLEGSNEMKKKIESLQKQLDAKPIQVEKPADTRELNSLSKNLHRSTSSKKS